MALAHKELDRKCNPVLIACPFRTENGCLASEVSFRCRLECPFHKKTDTVRRMLDALIHPLDAREARRMLVPLSKSI